MKAGQRVANNFPLREHTKGAAFPQWAIARWENWLIRAMKKQNFHLKDNVNISKCI